jgi:dTMP kinase
LAKDHVVLSDRYADSTIAYQGFGRNLDLDTLFRITQFATGGLIPDLTLFLDVDIRNGLERRSSGGGEMNRMDLQAIAFYEKVRDGYLQLASKESERWKIIDANRSVNLIQKGVREVVLDRLDLE